jgi:hypothetical protein
MGLIGDQGFAMYGKIAPIHSRLPIRHSPVMVTMGYKAQISWAMGNTDQTTPLASIQP